MNKLTPGQVAAKLGVSRQQIDKWLRAGRIRHVVLENGARLIERKHAKKPKAEKPGRKPAN
jgi:excisionase family DNA binding protein